MKMILCAVLLIMPTFCVLVGAWIQLSYRMRPPRSYTRWKMESGDELPTAAK